MITLARLVVNDRDETGCVGAESVLCGGIGYTPSRYGIDRGCGTVGAAYYLVQCTAVSAV